MRNRTYVRVMLDADENGLITPVSLMMRGIRMDIDRVLERRQARATKTGGQGMRYTVRIGSRQAFLFQDDERRWFMEEDDRVR